MNLGQDGIQIVNMFHHLVVGHQIELGVREGKSTLVDFPNARAQQT